jgi:hypothetical protein
MDSKEIRLPNGLLVELLTNIDNDCKHDECRNTLYIRVHDDKALYGHARRVAKSALVIKPSQDGDARVMAYDVECVE